MVEQKIMLNPADSESIGKLQVAIPPNKLFSISSESGEFKNPDEISLCTINKDGLTIMSSLLAGRNINDTISELSTSHKGTSRLKLEQETITFLRRLYARDLIKARNEFGEVAIPNWEMEPVTDVHIFITHNCNLDCIHCLIVKEKRKELTIQEFKNVIDGFIDLGCTHLDITGGETTTKKGFLDLVDYATSKSLSVGLATNGTNWNEQDIERLISLKPEKVNISIYSANPLVHDQITQKPGSFEKSTSLAKRLIQTGIHVNFKCMVMRNNFGSFQTVADLAKEIGAGYQFDTHITSKTNSDISPLKERITDKQLWEFVNSPMCLPREEKIVNVDSIVCTAGVDRASVNAYGDVHPCAVFPINAGNVKDQSLTEIWRNSPTLNEIRSLKFKDMGKCGFCPLLSRCSPCPGASYLEQANFRESPRWSCKFTKMIVKAGKGGDKNGS